MQFDPEVALSKATEVFRAHGYEATSTANLMSAMKLSKSSLYQTFGSKHELFMRCLDQYSTENGNRQRLDLIGAASGKQFLTNFFRNSIDPKKNGGDKCGCLLVNTASEFGDSNESLCEYVKTEAQRTSQLFQDAIEQSQEEGDIPKDKNAKHLADKLMVDLYGLSVFGKLSPDLSVMKPVVDQILNQLE